MYTQILCQPFQYVFSQKKTRIIYSVTLAFASSSNMASSDVQENVYLCNNLMLSVKVFLYNFTL